MFPMCLIEHTCVPSCLPTPPHAHPLALYRGSGAHSFPSFLARGGTRCVVVIVPQRPRGHLLTQQPRGARRALCSDPSRSCKFGCQLPMTVLNHTGVLQTLFLVLHLFLILPVDSALRLITHMHALEHRRNEPRRCSPPSPSSPRRFKWLVLYAVLIFFRLHVCVCVCVIVIVLVPDLCVQFVFEVACFFLRVPF
jgi:hypothetical protein